MVRERLRVQTLITLDYIVHENELLGQAWDKYKSLMPLVRSDPAAYGTSLCFIKDLSTTISLTPGVLFIGMTEESVSQFEQLLLNLNDTVMGGKMFQFCVGQNFNVPPGENLRSLNVSGNECVLLILRVFFTHVNGDLMW